MHTWRKFQSIQSKCPFCGVKNGAENDDLCYLYDAPMEHRRQWGVIAIPKLFPEPPCVLS